ncbi:hypothetical protein NIES2100_31410 [Calothrix sp. NIES-2100]|uniref:hypothetical protein n=1 Tax=Calothrix sp. NIES-2100 TaxID=1954172 RepID=UPI000B61D5D5|nr:hypothetical protein NIES2100_31410 [Calothrix sp. NIES-2100]
MNFCIKRRHLLKITTFIVVTATLNKFDKIFNSREKKVLAQDIHCQLIDRLWENYTNVIECISISSNFNNNEQLFTLTAPIIAVDFANKDVGVSNRNIYNLGNSVPAWSRNYIPKSDFLTSYRLFLDCIDLTPNTDSNKNKFSYNARENLDKFYVNLINAYDKDNIPKNSVFIKKIEHEIHKIKYNKYGSVYQIIEEARQKCNLALNSSQQNLYNMPVSITFSPPAGSQGVSEPPVKTFMPAYFLSGFLKRYEEWQSLSVNSKKEVSIIIDNDTQSICWNQEKYRSIIFPESAITLNKVSQKEQDCKIKFLKMKVEFTGLGIFQIKPGDWFDPSIVMMFKDRLIKGSPLFFGQNGLMGLLPSNVVIGFEPSITILFDKQHYTAVKEAYNDYINQLGSKTYFKKIDISSLIGNYKAVVSFDDESHLIKIVINSTVPVMLALISTKL